MLLFYHNKQSITFYSMPIHLLKTNSGTLSVSSSPGTFPAIWSSGLFAADPTTPVRQGEAPGKCQLSGKRGLAINRRCQGALWDGGRRREDPRWLWGRMAEMEKENCISLAARVSHDCQTASEALCEIWHLNIEISRYSYYLCSPNCRHGNWITERWHTENWDVLAGWMRPRRSGTKTWK